MLVETHDFGREIDGGGVEQGKGCLEEPSSWRSSLIRLICGRVIVPGDVKDKTVCR